jgi:hypothetical protein
MTPADVRDGPPPRYRAWVVLLVALIVVTIVGAGVYLLWPSGPVRVLVPRNGVVDVALAKGTAEDPVFAAQEPSVEQFPAFFLMLRSDDVPERNPFGITPGEYYEYRTILTMRGEPRSSCSFFLDRRVSGKFKLHDFKDVGPVRTGTDHTARGFRLFEVKVTRLD